MGSWVEGEGGGGGEGWGCDGDALRCGVYIAGHLVLVPEQLEGPQPVARAAHANTLQLAEAGVGRLAQGLAYRHQSLRPDAGAASHEWRTAALE